MASKEQPPRQQQQQQQLSTKDFRRGVRAFQRLVGKFRERHPNTDVPELLSSIVPQDEHLFVDSTGHSWRLDEFAVMFTVQKIVPRNVKKMHKQQQQQQPDGVVL